MAFYDPCDDPLIIGGSSFVLSGYDDSVAHWDGARVEQFAPPAPLSHSEDTVKKYGNYTDKNGKDRPDKKPAGVGEGDTAEFRGYINLNLSDDQKAAFDGWATDDTLRNATEYQVASGVNLSLKRDPKGQGFLASATQRDPFSPNAGLCATARGSSAQVAWGRLLFVLTILSEGERWEDTQPLANPDRW